MKVNFASAIVSKKNIHLNILELHTLNEKRSKWLEINLVRNYLYVYIYASMYVYVCIYL